MYLNSRILWSQGLFLTPQHFQEQDRLLDSAVAAVWQAGQPFGWGVLDLAIQRDGVPQSRIDVMRLTAVTRDGTFLRGGTAAEAGCNAVIRTAGFTLSPAVGPAGAYLLLARERAGANPIATPEQLAGGEIVDRRYVEDERQIADRFDPDRTGSAGIATLMHFCQIAVVPEGGEGPRRLNELRGGYEVLQLARLKPDGDRFILDEAYVPPCLTVAAVPPLLKRLESATDVLLDHIGRFTGMKRDRGLAMEVGTAQDVTLFLVLGALHRHASALKQMVERRQVHPADVYFILRQAVADLSAFSADVSYLGHVPAGDGSQEREPIQPYDQDDIGPRMVRAIARLDMLLDKLSLGPGMAIELAFDGQSTWGADIDHDFLGGRLPKFFLVVESTLGTEAVRQRLSDRKIGPRNEMQDLIDRRLRGLELRFCPYPPEQLPQRSNRYTYFEVDQDDAYWKLIDQGGNIQLFCPELAGQEARIKLVKTLSER